MPKNKKQGIMLSMILSLLMIYLMAALNLYVRDGVSAEAWLVALERLPLGFVFGILCDLFFCTPTSIRIVKKITKPDDDLKYKIFVLRFSMVILMTVVMTVFSVFASRKFGLEGVIDFFTYLPYNFTIALPIQMLFIAPLSVRIMRALYPFVFVRRRHRKLYRAA